MATVVVTGANGQIGRELQVLAHHYPAFQFHFTSKTNLDVTDEEAVVRFFNEYPPATASMPLPTRRSTKQKKRQLLRKMSTPTLPCTWRKPARNSISPYCTTPRIMFTTTVKTGPSRKQDDTHPHGVYARTKLKLATKPHSTPTKNDNRTAHQLGLLCIRAQLCQNHAPTRPGTRPAAGGLRPNWQPHLRPQPSPSQPRHPAAI